MSAKNDLMWQRGQSEALPVVCVCVCVCVVPLFPINLWPIPLKSEYNKRSAYVFEYA